MKEQKLKVTGMTCGHCEMNVKNRLEAVAGVQGAVVDRETNSAVVQYDPNKASSDELLASLSDTNYTATLDE